MREDEYERAYRGNDSESEFSSGARIPRWGSKHLDFVEDISAAVEDGDVSVPYRLVGQINNLPVWLNSRWDRREFRTETAGEPVDPGFMIKGSFSFGPHSRAEFMNRERISYRWGEGQVGEPLASIGHFIIERPDLVEFVRAQYAKQANVKAPNR